MYVHMEATSSGGLLNSESLFFLRSMELKSAVLWSDSNLPQSPREDNKAQFWRESLKTFN